MNKARYKCGVWLVLLLANTSQAGVVGVGNFSLGASQDQSRTNGGINGDYRLTAALPTQEFNWTAAGEYGTEEGRAAAASSAHRFQFDDPYFQNTIDHTLFLPSPHFQWKSNAQRRVVFEESKADETLIQDRQVSWSVNSGPYLTYTTNQRIQVEASAIVGRQLSSGTLANENILNLSVTKPVTKLSKLKARGRRVCTEYEAEDRDNECRTEITGGVIGQYKYFNYTAEIGEAQTNNSDELLFSIDAEYKVNDSTQMSLRSNQTITDTQTINELDNDRITLNSTSLTRTDTANYRYQWGRYQVQFMARRTVFESDDKNTIDREFSSFLDYQLPKAFCRGCKLESSYEYSDFGDKSLQKIITFGIEKSLSRRWSTDLNMRSTQVVGEESITSINWVISYRGEARKVASRY